MLGRYKDTKRQEYSTEYSLRKKKRNQREHFKDDLLLWQHSVYLSPLIGRIYVAEHGQRESSGFTCARL